MRLYPVDPTWRAENTVYELNQETFDQVNIDPMQRDKLKLAGMFWRSGIRDVWDKIDDKQQARLRDKMVAAMAAEEWEGYTGRDRNALIDESKARLGILAPGIEALAYPETAADREKREKKTQQKWYRNWLTMLN